MLEYHKEKEEELSNEVHDAMMKVRGLFPKHRNFPKENNWVWHTVWTEKTDDLNDEKWVREKIKKLMNLDGSGE